MTRPSFMDLYLRACGRTMVPLEFNRWSCVALVSASLADRVYVEKMKKHLVPNMYIILVGPSGCGKGEAIDRALGLVKHNETLKKQVVRGGLTKQRLLDMLGGRSTKVVKGQAAVDAAEANPAPWIVYPELYNSLGAGGPIAEQFIANLTDMYSGSPVPITEGTRTWGDVVIQGYCINWLAGTTIQWLRRSLSPDAILSGFFGRVVAIEGRYAEAWTDAVYPPDYDALMAQLVERLAELQHVEGECRLTEDAQAVRQQWLALRDKPTDEMLRPAYQRDDDMLLKLCMVLSACEREDGVITAEHVSKARSLVLEARRSLPNLVTMAHMRPGNDGILVLESVLRSHQRLTRSQLTRLTASRGLSAFQQDQFITTLTNAGRMRSRQVGRTTHYEWVEARQVYTDELGPSGALEDWPVGDLSVEGLDTA